MQITDILNQVGGLDSIARELGISQAEASRGAAALAPAILGGYKKQVQGAGSGLDGLGGLLGQLGGSGLLDQVLSPQPTNVSQGNEVLGQIFGSKDVSRAVAQKASSESGLDASILKKMLPMLAMLVSGYMAKQAAAPSATPSGDALGGLGGMLGGLLGGKSAPASQAGQGMFGGLGSLLDMDGDGNPLDDIMRMMGK